MESDTLDVKVFTYEVTVVVKILATNEEEAAKICETQGGYGVSRTQKLITN